MTDKTAIIIGASRGIGLALVAELAGRGWQVTATARGVAPDLASLAAASDGRITLATVDIDDDASCIALDTALTGQDFDLVFVNAGTYGPAHQSVDKVTAAEMGALMMTNAIAPIRLAKRLLPRVKPGGTIALMSSILGSVALNEGGTTALYRASKAGLNIIARGFYVEAVKPLGLTLLNLHPGWVKTDMGGPQAPVEIADSVRGLADVLAANTAGGHHYLDYQGNILPW
jgi:NAD(P)-dependent dehydrogenase (short-subunit alcohol dehydrogenase family)